MAKTENAELTVLCLLEKDGSYLLQDRVKQDWKGYTLPGGHVEPGESFVDAAIRELQEESGLTMLDPVLCGVKQFPTPEGRYVVFLFHATEYTGTLTSSEEGEMHWVSKEELDRVNLVSDFHELLDVMLDPAKSEFQYVIQNGDWIPSMR